MHPNEVEAVPKLIKRRIPRYAGALSLLLLASFWAGTASAQFRIADIRVEGLQRVSAGTVFSYLPVQIDDTVADDVTADIIRSLYATGFFDDVKVERDANVLVIWVRERPAVAQIDIVGNKSIKTEDLEEGLKEIGLAEGRVFNRSVLDRIEQELRRQYFAAGKYGMDVESTVSPLERNRVAVRIQVTEGLTARLKQVNIIGNKDFKEKTLLKQFKLGPTNWSSFYSKNDRYAKEKLAGDLEALRSFYLDRGYINFQITSTQVTISPDKNDIYVTIGIDEGEVFHVSDIRLAGDPSVPVEQLFPLIQMQRGTVFSRKAASESAERISDLLGNEGYAFANVNTVPEVDAENKTVAVTFFVDPGKRVYVRRVNMRGNTRTRDEVLRREMRQLETAWFSADRVEQSRERLKRLGFFDDVTVETPAVPGSPDLVDVDVTVKEKPSGNLLAGVGYSQSDGILFNTSISQNNFLGTGKQVSFAFNASSGNQLYQLAYTNPYYTVDGISRGFNLMYQTTNYDDTIGADYSTDVGLAGVNFGLPISDTSRAGFGARYQYTNFFAGDYSALAKDFVAQNGTEYNDFFLSASYTKDSRDSAVFPTKGTLQSLYGEVAVPGSDLEFYRITYRGRQYIPLTQRFTFALRAEFGYGGGYGDTSAMPFFNNFYAGGPGSVRGWEAYSLGPRETTQENDPVGGNMKLTGSVELFAPPPVGGKFADTLRLGAFFDFGNVWWTEPSDLVAPTGFDLGELRYSAGLSLAWLSPVGALSLSFAYPINPQSGDDTQVFQFSFGQNF
ncbi:outer membrane protein assembly factor BamA [Thiorhodovibrio frisius]|uniref:Outer membrane protein assembly factor BamA n=1 Tax=Thiorhodovibrio frisius TaxID=631362 RepID=H8Z810_9GAMM|nr:outer membrane protein assembly factor BamA [Thiorhodovibrio frisius]EIC19945.1 outer membrane protein assembly complex, YaeT protein [Thiorhodovibrio frisius]WPL20674.1 Outer membrane protein assembly factor BamA precursor [Thiorhodovibrio frisius]